VVNPDGLSASELAAIRGLQRSVPTPLADDPVWDRLGADGFKFVKLCEKAAGSGLPAVRCHELTSRGYAYRTD
jgi:hypothetical protein